MGRGNNWLVGPLSFNFKILFFLHFCNCLLSFGSSTQTVTIEAVTEGTPGIETGVETNLTTSQNGDISSDIAELQEEVRLLRGQVKEKQNEITNLLGEKDLIKRQLIRYKSFYCQGVNVSIELHNALYSQHEDVARTLVRCGANVNALNYGQTPLHRVALLKDKGVATRLIKLLIERDANPLANDDQGCTFLHNLVENGTTLTPSQFHDMAYYLISKNMSDMFNTPCRSRSMWDFILNKRPTPLMKAVKNIEVEMSTLTLLKGNGVDFKVVDSEGKSVLFYAVRGSTRLLSDLISIGGNWRVRDKKRQNLLHIAAFRGNEKIVEYLIKLGLDVDSVDDVRHSPLHKVVEGENGNVLETVRVLIRNGADITIRDRKGMTPLNIAHGMSWFADKEKVIELLNF